MWTLSQLKSSLLKMGSFPTTFRDVLIAFKSNTFDGCHSTPYGCSTKTSNVLRKCCNTPQKWYLYDLLRFKGAFLTLAVSDYQQSSMQQSINHTVVKINIFKHQAITHLTTLIEVCKMYYLQWKCLIVVSIWKVYTSTPKVDKSIKVFTNILSVAVLP